MGRVVGYSNDNGRSALYRPAMVLTLVLGTSFCQAMDRSPAYPIGPSTIPPSSYSNDLVPMPNPLDASGNLVMTGNVAAGMHFRGRVPYRAPTDLRTPLGSTYLDAFLRYSQPALDGWPMSGSMTPFYSPTAGATRIMPGSADPIIPQTSWAGLVLWNGATQDPWDRSTSGGAGDSSTPAWSLVAQTPGEVQKAIRPGSTDTPWTDLLLASQARDAGQAAAPEQDLVGLPTLLDGIDGNQPVVGTIPDHERSHALAEGVSEDPCRVFVAGMSYPAPDKTTHRIGSLDAFWQVRYERCMEIARSCLKDGKPYQAVDAYTLAIMYKPADTLALAGKGHALFACGEFVTSALFLARTLEVCPDYARIPIDLAGSVGGEGVLRPRIEEAEKYLRQSDSIELRMILAYVHYRLGDVQAAKQTLAIATDKVQQGPALRALKGAIEGSLNTDP